MKRVAVIHGPNFNMLGIREPGVYGALSLEELNQSLRELGQKLGAEVSCFQSNHEGELVDMVHKLHGSCDGIVLNAAAYTHTSVAIRDALLTVSIPFVEVHMSNVHAREPFRHRSFLADVAVGVICGFGADSYALGLRALISPELRDR